MKSIRIPLLISLLAPVAAAQDGAPTPPNANDPAYAPLKAFVGTWTCDVNYLGTSSKATETFEPLCNGLFMKSIVHGSFNGQPFHGLSIWGYDPQAKNYVNVWVDSTGTTPAWSTATYDATTKTMTSSSEMGGMKMRGVLKWTSPDAFEEKTYNLQGDKQVEHMTIKRTRAKAGAATAVSDAASVAGETKVQAEKAATAVAEPVTTNPASNDLLKTVGKWDVVMKVMGPDGTAMEFKGKESNSAACNGLWVWSDFHSDDFMGTPFTGAGLLGYDPSTKKYTSVWVDSMSPHITKLSGSMDAKTKVLTCKGMSKDPAGNEMPMQESTTWTNDDARICRFEFGSGEQTMKMELHYTRAHEVPDHGIPATKIK
ncbi:MAG: DUF1579 family protein [Planctomycetota bacterium]